MIIVFILLFSPSFVRFFLIFYFIGKITEFVELLKEWTSFKGSGASAENVMMGVTLEELYNMPAAKYAHQWGGFLNKQLNVYHIAFHACADLKNLKILFFLLNFTKQSNLCKLACCMVWFITHLQISIVTNMIYNQ